MWVDCEGVAPQSHATPYFSLPHHFQTISLEMVTVPAPKTNAPSLLLVQELDEVW